MKVIDIKQSELKRHSLKNKIRLALAALCASIILIWIIFYVYSVKNLRAVNEANMEKISEQMIDRLETKLLSFEKIAFTIGNNEILYDYFTESAPIAYHHKSKAVAELVSAAIEASDFEGIVIIYNRDGVYSRFSGELGNTASGRAYTVFESLGLPGYASIKLEGKEYIGFASEVYEENTALGMVLLLMEENKILGMFSDLLQIDGFQISLAFDGLVLSSSEPAYTGFETSDLQTASSLYLNREIGFAPFEVIVSMSRANNYYAVVYNNYLAAILITAALFFVLIITFIHIYNRDFFQPMLGIMQDVSHLGAQEDLTLLQKTGIADFDNLVEQINLMLKRLDEKTKDLLKAQAHLQRMEIERQKALIMSLKKQIHNHFTVNTLYIAIVLIKKGEKDNALKMLEGLCRILQYANAEEEFTTGLEEAEILAQYVDIMQIRYKNRFQILFDWDEYLDWVKLPRMLIQPIVENAIAHGMTSSAQTGRIDVTALLDNGKIVITVQDNGGGMDQKTLESLKKKIALAKELVWQVEGITQVALPNIQRRIWLYYGEEAQLSITSELGTGTKVVVKLPQSKEK